EQMAWETEELKLDPQIIRSGIRDVFIDESKGLYFIAEVADRIAASLLITFEWSDWRSSWVYWIQSVYVEPAFRRMGIYKALYTHIQEIVKEKDDVAGIRLYVERTNHAAQQTYAALGMDGQHYQLFEWMKLY
ncbi:MAG TPA: GNAT family N-acetyltransferase, partial [Bacteroidales bacterium]|nr:GNAT family N-acetyltransferase [Bacteroidales bacterium]